MNKHKERKQTPIYQGVVKYFPLALGAISQVSRQGNIQHKTGDPDGELIWAKHKSNDHLDCLMRHLCDVDTNPIDDDGIHHDVKVAWRALAHLQIRLENEEGS